MSKKIYVLTVLCLCLLVSCEKNKYKIALNPQSDSIQREVICWREDDKKNILEFPQTQLDQISQTYKVPSQKAGAKKYEFSGTFNDKMPNDIGGEGYYLHTTTTMGDSFFYSERFRGNDDLQIGLQQRRQAVNELVDIVIGWFQSEMRWEWKFGKLKTFLDRDFRWDMQNICLYGWSANLTGKDKEMGYRSIQYLAERDYFDLQEFLEALNEFRYQEKYDKFFAIIRRIATREMGYNTRENLPKSLAFLTTTESAQKTLEKYLRTSKQYKAYLKEVEKHKIKESSLRDPEPLDTMGNLISQATGGNEIGVYIADELEVALFCSVEPYQTNGKWNAEKHILEWTQTIENSDSKLPTYLFAAWSIPNEAFQKTHFGRIVLKGSSLEEYALWQKSLNEAQKKEWDTFLESLTPSPKLKEKLEAFRFSTDPKDLSSKWTKLFCENLTKPASQPAGGPATMPTTQTTQPAQ